MEFINRISIIRQITKCFFYLNNSILKINAIPCQSKDFCFCQYKSKKNLLLIRKKHHCFHPVMLLRTILFRLCFFFFVENVIHLPVYLHTSWFINKDFLNNLRQLYFVKILQCCNLIYFHFFFCIFFIVSSIIH